MLPRILCVVAAALLGAARLASGQVAESFHDLQPSLHAGDRLRVTDDGGLVTTGRLTALSDRSLRLLVSPGTPLEMSASSVHKIERVTSRAGKGALVGLIGGAAAGLVGVAMSPECEGFCVGPSKGAILFPIAGLFGGIGAGVGALIGAAHPRRQLVFLVEAPSSP